ncbi:S-layer homology domain-containing protein [Paenibacillus nasutitermitis]|uniref:S-layer homology domain-containing protein n=1 Tax=Paenibacillus nasutitermitis TaxID=1652958 RepID=UPI001666991D|nr:S-layer homology domain-containing protein [Paenibacillus nasutitermitis]
MRKRNRGWRAAVAAALIISLIGSVMPWVAAAKPNDTDAHWASQTMEKWAENGLLSGYADGSYQPDQSVTRAEFIALANRAYKLEARSPVVFKDVSAGKWYAPEFGKAVAAGYISGYEDGTARPAKQVTRQEAALMLFKLAKLDLEPAGGSGTGFTDDALLAGWGRTAVAAVSARNWLSGYPDGSFKPDRAMTRAEAVVVLDRALSDVNSGEVPEPEDKVYKEAGTYGPSEGVEEVAGNVVISAAGVKLRNMVITGNLTLDQGIGEGDVHLENVTVQGTTTVHGGGANSVYLNDSTFHLIIVSKLTGQVRLVLEGNTIVDAMQVLSRLILVLSGSSSIGTMEVRAVLAVTGQGLITEALLYVTGSTFERKPGKLTPKYPAEPDPAPNAPYPGGGGISVPDPAPVITGVQDGQTYWSYVTPASTGAITSAVLEKDGIAVASYAYGDLIKESGDYVLTLGTAGGSRSTVRFKLRSDVKLTALQEEIIYRDHKLTFPVHLSNNGADYDQAVNSLKISISGLAADARTLSADYETSDGRSISGLLLERDGEAFSTASFQQASFKIIKGQDLTVIYTMDLGPSLQERSIQLESWVGSADNVSQQQAIARLQALHFTAEADPAAPVTDLSVTAKTGTTVDMSFTQPSGAENVFLELSEDNGGSWRAAATSEQLTALSASAQVIGLEQGTSYHLRLRVAGGWHAGVSNTVAVTTNEPDPVVTGVQDGQTYPSYVTPQSAEGKTIIAAILVKDGVEDEYYELGNTLTESGSYELTVTEDNLAMTTIRFALVPLTQLTVINDDQYRVNYVISEHRLSIPVHVANTGADFADAVNGVKLTAPGLDGDVDSLRVLYGDAGSSPYAFFYLYREEDTDDFFGTFPPSPYTLDSGWDQNVNYSVELPPSWSERMIHVEAWVASVQNPSQAAAIAQIETVNFLVEADQPALINDLAVMDITDTTIMVLYSSPHLATEMSIEISEDGGETWQSADTQSPLTVDSNYARVVGLSAGTAYRIRLNVADGINAGPSNEVTATTLPS